MSYSVVVCKIPNFIRRREQLVSYQSLVSELLKNEFDLYGELKYGYVGISYAPTNNTRPRSSNDIVGFFNGRGRSNSEKTLILCQAAYKYDEIYNSHFFELISKEEFGAITKQLVTEEFVLLRDAVSPAIFDVDEDEEHILLPHGDLILIENEYNELPFIFQQFYKFKKTDLEQFYYSPDRMDSNPELVAAKDRFNALQFRNQLGINEDNRVGGNRRKINKKIKTNKKRKQRMRKTKHKW
jgi:hypothetical protein